MGIQNIQTVYARWGALDGAPFRLLVFMAMVTMDDEDIPRYFATRDVLIRMGLGKSHPDEPAKFDHSRQADDDRRRIRANEQALKVALAALKKAGALSVLRPAAPGRSAEYGLLIHSPTGKAEPTERGRLTLPTGYDNPTGTGKAEPTRNGDPLRGSPLEENLEDEVRTNRGTKLPLSGTSPREEIDFPTASRLLQSLPDLGSAYMQQFAAVPGMEARTIAAAIKYLEENPNRRDRIDGVS